MVAVIWPRRRIEFADLPSASARRLAQPGVILRDLAQPLRTHRRFRAPDDRNCPSASTSAARSSRCACAAPCGDAVGLGIGSRRQPRLAEGTAHLGIGHVALDLGHRLFGGGHAGAQLVGAASDVVWRRSPRVAIFSAAAIVACAVRSAVRVASPASWLLRRAGLGDLALP